MLLLIYLIKSMESKVSSPLRRIGGFICIPHIIFWLNFRTPAHKAKPKHKQKQTALTAIRQIAHAKLTTADHLTGNKIYMQYKIQAHTSGDSLVHSVIMRFV